MASAYWDKACGQWVADFRPPFAPGRKRARRRLPHCRGASDKVEALAAALEMERLARVVEVNPMPGAVARAVELQVVTEADGALLCGDPVAMDQHALGPLTIEQAAMQHPSTIKETKSDIKNHRKHMRAVQAFCVWSGARLVEDLVLERVQSWVAELVRRGL